MAKSPHLFISAGDVSADQHAAALVQDLRAHCPELRVTALGGVRLRTCADSFRFSLVGVGGFGFLEPIFKIRQLWKAWRIAVDILDYDTPDMVVPVDYYGFNIHVARAAHRRKIPVLYYISPQIWASRKTRLLALRAAIDRMMVIFPFEVALYSDANVPVDFVGHPLVSKLVPGPDTFSERRVGLMPGSRPDVIERHLPIMGATATLIKEKCPDADFILIKPEVTPAHLFSAFQARCPWIKVVSDSTYHYRRSLTVAITVSGTTSLENALLGIPMVVMYRLSQITYQIAKRLILLPYVAMPNILAGRVIVPEFLQNSAKPEALADSATSLLTNRVLWAKMREDLLTLRTGLAGNPTTASNVILQALEKVP